MIEKIEKNKHNNKQFCEAILTDFSKAFDYICYDLLTIKINVYGFKEKALKFIYDFLNGKVKWVLHSLVN